MSYSYYKFDRNDVFINTVQLYPQVKFLIYSGTAYYNDRPNIVGSFADPITLVSSSHLSLYELNVDRVSSSNEVSDPAVASQRLVGPPSPIGDVIPDNGLIYPWIIKDGTRMNLRTSTSEVFANTPVGSYITGSYPLTASLTKTYYSATHPRADESKETVVGGVTITGSVSRIKALENVINYYTFLSPQFEYSSSATAKSAGISSRDFDSSSLGLISIPSIFYGSEIQKGTINLEYYFTGTLIARAQDTRRNGELIQTYGGANGTTTGSIVGLALYNEGFLILTGAAALNNSEDRYINETGSADNPRWVYFGQSISSSINASPGPVIRGRQNITCPSSSFVIDMSGTTNTQVFTMFATAPKGELNHSNNPTYLKYDFLSSPATGSIGYLEHRKREIKNVVSSAYNDPTGSFEKTTYISKIGIYDKDKNLIAIAKTATPLRKTVERDLTFKLKLDI